MSPIGWRASGAGDPGFVAAYRKAQMRLKVPPHIEAESPRCAIKRLWS